MQLQLQGHSRVDGVSGSRGKSTERRRHLAACPRGSRGRTKGRQVCWYASGLFCDTRWQATHYQWATDDPHDTFANGYSLHCDIAPKQSAFDQPSLFLAARFSGFRLQVHLSFVRDFGPLVPIHGAGPILWRWLQDGILRKTCVCSRSSGRILCCCRRRESVGRLFC